MKIAASKSKAAKAIPLSLVLSAFLIIVYTLHGISPSSPNDATANHDNDAVAVHRLLSSVVASDVIPNVDINAYDYLIIHYHKTGHEVAYSLTGRIKDDGTMRHYFKTVRHDPLLKRDHDQMTKCPRVELKLGMLNVQAAPDFFCHVNVLAEELLHGSTKKRGIKIIHLVRNPFRLAVSNYKYHSQFPTPERWVKGLDVCRAVEEPINWPELLMPTLGVNGVMRYEDFDSILALCHSLFRTRAGLEQADFYTHLMKLDPLEGLFLATTHMMRGRVGDIARMASNIIKLEELQQLEVQVNIAQHHLLPEKRIQVLTLAMEEFTERPKETAMHFFDFLLRDPLLAEAKENMATEYERGYLELKDKGNSDHITMGSSDNAMLEATLREHDLFGRILGNIERVVDDVLAGSK